MFLDDIVDDDVLPYPNLAVDGLTSASAKNREQFQLRPEDAVNDEYPPDSRIPDTPPVSEQLDVYGWENSLWRKIKAYLGL